MDEAAPPLRHPDGSLCTCWKSSREVSLQDTARAVGRAMDKRGEVEHVNDALPYVRAGEGLAYTGDAFIDPAEEAAARPGVPLRLGCGCTMTGDGRWTLCPDPDHKGREKAPPIGTWRSSGDEYVRALNERHKRIAESYGVPAAMLKPGECRPSASAAAKPAPRCGVAVYCQSDEDGDV